MSISISKVKIAGNTSGNVAEVDSSNNLQTTNLTIGPVSPGTAATKSSLGGAIYNSTPPVATNGQQVSFQADSGGNLKVAVFGGQINVVPIGTLATYSAATTGLIVATSPTDVFTITGSATKTVKISKILFSGIQTNSSNIDVLLIKRSTANSGGTSTTLTNVSHDSSDAAATATVVAYTANPTLGTAVGTMISTIASVPNKNTTTGGVAIALIDLSSPPQKNITLRGTSEALSINLNAVSMPGSSLDISIEWTEE